MDEKCNIKSCLLKRKNPDTSDDIKEIFALNILCKEIDVEIVLEWAIVLHKKWWVFQTDQVERLLLFLRSDMWYLDERDVLLLCQWLLWDTFQGEVQVLLLMSDEKNLSIGSRTTYFPCIEMVKLIVFGKIPHFVYLARSHLSLFFLLSSMISQKVRSFDSISDIATQRLLNLANWCSGYLASFSELNIEFIVVIRFLATSCFFYGLQTEKLFLIEVLFICVFYLFDRRKDLLTGFGVDELREDNIGLSLDNEKNRIFQLFVSINDGLAFLNITNNEAI